jgi:signal transduction histidine kinase
MKLVTNKLEEFLGAILRGAAKLLGCASTNLVLINERTGELRIQIGAMAEDYPILETLERSIGNSFGRISLPLDSAVDSMVMRSWRERTLLETDSLATLVGSALHEDVTSKGTQLIGEHRFICVPAQCNNRGYGILVFTKKGRHPFNRQQREVLLRYAHRIGEMIENEKDNAIWAMHQMHHPFETSLENQLLELTLGEAAPVLFVDPDLRITSCNEATEQLFSSDAAHLLQRPLADLIVRPQDIVHVFRQQIMDPVDPYHEERAVIVRGNGTLQPASIEALFLADDRHKAVGFLVLIRVDEDAHYRISNQLLIQERLATMGEMAMQLAHEIRNPLLAIGVTLKTLSREQMNEEQTQTLDAVSREIDRLDMTLRQYLDPSRDLCQEETSVAEVVEETRRLLEGSHSMDGKTITASIDPNLTIQADYDAIKHVFFNLLLNALESSPVSGEVIVRATRNKRHISISIDDNGEGLGANEEKCFQPFFTTKKNGTGLGLAVCQKITRQLGGLVELKNRPSGGCRASVILPNNGSSPPALHSRRSP